MKSRDHEEVRDKLRRRILFWIPPAVFASIGAALAANAFRFLRPRVEAPPHTPRDGAWTRVAPADEVRGERPIARRVSVERQTGWSVTREEKLIYIQPRHGNLVFSAVCPHEGCDVEWVEGQGEFVCPCHDSRFDADGAPLGGPAQTGLKRLPSRVSAGVLEIRFGDEARAASRTDVRERA